MVRKPQDEIQAGELSLDLFAAKLRLVVAGKVPKVYQDPKTFFANTFSTDGLIMKPIGSHLKRWLDDWTHFPV